MRFLIKRVKGNRKRLALRPKKGKWILKRKVTSRIKTFLKTQQTVLYGELLPVRTSFLLLPWQSNAMNTRITPGYANILKWRLTGQIGVNMRALTHLHYSIQAPSVITSPKVTCIKWQLLWKFEGFPISSHPQPHRRPHLLEFCTSPSCTWKSLV